MRWTSETIITNNLKSVLAEKKLTHSRLANRLQVHPKMVAAWCENARQPDVIVTLHLMEALEMTSADYSALWNKHVRSEASQPESNKSNN